MSYSSSSGNYTSSQAPNAAPRRTASGFTIKLSAAAIKAALARPIAPIPRCSPAKMQARAQTWGTYQGNAQQQSGAYYAQSSSSHMHPVMDEDYAMSATPRASSFNIPPSGDNSMQY